MKIIIKGSEYEYHSDHPNGWDLSTRDHFKGPVAIGPQSCFIKRFERKNIEDVSGWQLLLSLKGKKEPNLPNLYDIAHDQENGKNTYYVFFEYLEGTTLDKIIDQKVSIDLTKLAEDLFKAFHPIHIKNYWVTNFIEKNIFCEKGGRFLLVDLHHTSSMSDLRDTEFIDDNIYWKLVFNFYREILHQRNLKTDDLNGSSINYLQAVFVLLKLQLSYKEKSAFDSEDLFKKLPVCLAEASPSFKDIYANVFRSSELALPSRDVAYIKKVALELVQESSITAAEEITVPPAEVSALMGVISAAPEELSVLPEEKSELLEALSVPPEELSELPEGTGVSPEELSVAPEELSLPPAQTSVLPEETNVSPEELSVTQGELSIPPAEISLPREQISVPPEEPGVPPEELSVGPEAKSLPPEEISIPTEHSSLTIENHPPKIVYFILEDYTPDEEDTYTVAEGEPFTLSWAVQNAANTELYRNEIPYSTLDSSQKNIELKEIYHGSEAGVTYKLSATSPDGGLAGKALKLKVKEPLKVPPVIQQFTLAGYTEKNDDEYHVTRGEYFTLNWKVRGAENLDIYKNGSLYRVLNNTDQSIELEEVLDNQEENLVYTLHARNGYALSVSDPLTVKLKEPAGTPPEIISFTADNYLVDNRHQYTLTWSLKNVSHLALYRNGTLYKDLNPTDESIRFRETFANNQDQVEYTLTASNRLGEVKSIPLVIKLKAKAPVSPPTKTPYLKIAGAILGAALIILVTKWVVVNFRHPNTVVVKIEPQNIYEDSSIIIYGKNFTDAKTLQVLFNDLQGTIKSFGNDSLVVTIPNMKNKISATGDVTVTVKANGYDLFLYNYQWFDKSAVAVNTVNISNFLVDTTVTVYCRNLNNAREIKVYFNYIRSKIRFQGGDSVIVSVPETIIDSIPKSIKLNIKDGNKDVYTYSFIPR